jgi:glucokinase
MLHLNDNEFISLNPNAKKTQANCAVIAAGTGLGEAILFYDRGSYQAIATEGGHTDFAPQTPLQDELLKWLRKQYKEHVSYERILSGEGIYTLYRFLSQNSSETIPNINSYQDKSAMISHFAIEKNHPLCRDTLDLFCEIYAAEAGNLALKCNAQGGIYIGGGIAPKILPFIDNDKFINKLTCKGRFKDMLNDIEVKVSLNPQTALLGAGHFAMGA